MSEIFQPASGSHSLLETVFFVQFNPHIDPSAMLLIVEQLRALEALSTFFPKSTPLQAISFRVEPGHEPTSVQAVGLEFIRSTTAGTAEWVLRLMPDGLSVHCLSYTRWDEVWPQAAQLLRAAMPVIPSGVGLNAIGLKTIDRFEYVGEGQNSYQLERLLKTDSPHVASRSFSAGYRWHCHSGWFTNIEVQSGRFGNLEVLNQINVDGGPQPALSGEKVFVGIDHNQVVSGPIKWGASHSEWLDLTMKSLHLNNKSVLSELLTDYMAKRINLVVEAKL